MREENYILLAVGVIGVIAIVAMLSTVWNFGGNNAAGMAVAGTTTQHIVIQEEGDYYVKFDWYNSAAQVTLSLIQPNNISLGVFYGYYPKMPSDVYLGHFYPGNELVFSHINSWNGGIYGPFYSTDSSNYVIASTSTNMWSLTFDDGLHVGGLDGQFEIYKKLSSNVSSPVCGNGVIEGNEICDPGYAPTAVKNCTAFMPTWIGTAACKNTCDGYNTDTCAKPTNVNISNTTATCTDSDGGNMSYLRGTANSSSGYAWTDLCQNDNSGLNNSNVLYEGTCLSNGSVSILSVTCPNGCINGACIAAPTINNTNSTSCANIASLNTCINTRGCSLYDDASGCTIDDPIEIQVDYCNFANITDCINSKGCVPDNGGYNCVVAAPSEIHNMDQITNFHVENGNYIFDMSYVYDKFYIDGTSVTFSSTYLGGAANMRYAIPYRAGKLLHGYRRNHVTGLIDGAIGVYINGYTNTVNSSNATSSTTFCYDSDGNNIFTLGTVVLYNATAVIQNVTDYCTTPAVDVVESTCVNGIPTLNEYTCPNGCSNGACISNITNLTGDYTLKDFPQPFLNKGGQPNAVFVVGRRATVDDVIGITDIVASLQRYAGNNPLPTGLVRFDDELSSSDYNNNMVVIGGPCANAAAAYVYDNPQECVAYDTPGVGKISLKTKNGHYWIIVHGYYAEDTTRATRVLANWKSYSSLLDTRELCVSGTLDNMNVYKC